jgi:CRP/FNR family cyclic AMP-dependent transcriptional regulator
VTAHLQLLKRVPLFQGLSDDELTALEASLKTRRIAPRSWLFAKGDAGGSMFVIVRGKVRVLLPATQPGAASVLLNELGEGAFFGEMALIDNLPRMASAEVPDGAELLELTRDGLLGLLGRDPKIGMSMLAVMSHRLRAAADLLDTPAARDINRESDARQTWAERLADRVARWNGSWGFLIVLVVAAAVWTGINAVPQLAFDPYPYQFFNLFLAILVAIQGPLLMMSQNRQVAKERLHAEADYRVNLKNETGIHKVLVELAELRREVDQLKPALPPEALPAATESSSAAGERAA